MSEKKYAVPDGMLEAASLSTVRNNDFGYAHMDRIIKKVEETSCQWPGLEHILQAALRWQSKNAKGPTDKQFGEMVKDCGDANPGRWESFTEWQRAIILCGEWERRMYDAPETEVPDPEVDRVDFYVKTTDGRYVPWIPTEEQKVMMNLIVPEPVEGNNTNIRV